jgi:hypothetical protein
VKTAQIPRTQSLSRRLTINKKTQQTLQRHTTLPQGEELLQASMEDHNLLEFNDFGEEKKGYGTTTIVHPHDSKVLPHELLKDQPYPGVAANMGELREISQITVGLRIVNLGSDIKFEEDPFNVTLNDIMDPFDYSSSIRKINVELEKCRASAVDHALLTAGPAIIPLIPWAIRQKMRKNTRRKILAQCIEAFNKEHPQLFMRWQTRPLKELTIMTKSAALKLMSK